MLVSAQEARVFPTGSAFRPPRTKHEIDQARRIPSARPSNPWLVSEVPHNFDGRGGESGGRGGGLRALGGLLASFPAHLAERAALVGRDLPNDRGEFVLYWCHHAMRAEENPALDLAAELAIRTGRSLLVCAGIGGAHPYLSDRHMTFMLEGYRDLAGQLAARGIPFACCLAPSSRPDALIDRLAARAYAIVTEDVPSEPFPDWTASIARRSERPVVVVDTACVIPMNRVEGVFDRAYAFRDAIARERAARVDAAWPEPSWRGRRWPMVDHGVPAIDWATADLGEIVASLDIDHSVGPVLDTPGGSTAGRARWDAFRQSGLADYARLRDDAAVCGVSRMSAYLHYGMVSPMRIAREASAAGAEKYLDELIVWRELAYHWCRHVPAHTSLDALPAWARRTLEAHRGDARATVSWERLSRGRSPDELWNLAQQSLVVHGELHNNLRMTWGKAVPAWTASPRDALATLIALNNRYALDGCDPASYGGILWCLGLFDRAFSPETPVLGSVRARPLEIHAARLDVDAYRALAACRTRPMRVAVIGAGIAGLACARTLADHLVDVVVFEKSRGAGGRMSTRRSELGAFDHGAQYFTARDPRFAELVRSWREDGVVARWDARFAEIGPHGAMPFVATDRFVGTPSMSALCAHFAKDAPMIAETRVTAIERMGARWLVRGVSAGVDRVLGEFDAVLSTAPAPQTAQLFGPVAPALAALAARRAMGATWSLMWACEGPTGLPFDHAQVHSGAREVGETLAWVSRVSSKPGRTADGIERWTILGRREWSEERLERSPAETAVELSEAFSRLGESLGVPIPAALHAEAHRWRFALAVEEGGPRAAFDAGLRLGIAGDWLSGSRVEDAYLAGIALAGRALAAGGARVQAPVAARIARS